MERHEWKFIPRLTLLDSTDEDEFFFKEKKVWMRFKGDGEKRREEEREERNGRQKQKRKKESLEVTLS